MLKESLKLARYPRQRPQSTRQSTPWFPFSRLMPAPIMWFYLGSLLLVGLGACVSLAQAQSGASPSPPTGIPVQIGWQVPLSREVSFILEVARDAGFGQIVLTTQVRGTGHLWVAPGEGVYHWRLAKADKKHVGGEVMSTVSGSFVAVDPLGERSAPARISWGQVAGADQYKVYMFDQEGRTRISTTKAFSLLVPQGLKITMIEVVPHKGAMSVEKSYHFLPTLFFTSGRTKKIEPPVPAPVAMAKEPQKGAETASPPKSPENPPQAASLSPDPTQIPQEQTVGERPLHRISVNGLFVSETLTLEKLDLNLGNTLKSGGAEIRIWTSPVHGLVVSLEGAGWQAVGDLDRAASQVADGGVPMKSSLTATRFLGRVGIGFDIMSLWDITSTSLSLSLVGASSSQPMLPRVYKIPLQEPFNIPDIKDEVITMGGGKVGFFWASQVMGVSADFYHLIDAERNHRVSGQSLVSEFYPLKSLALQMGVWAQQGQWVLCDEDPTLCLSEGKVSTTSRVVGGLLGGGIILQ